MLFSLSRTIVNNILRIADKNEVDRNIDKLYLTNKEIDREKKRKVCVYVKQRE